MTTGALTTTVPALGGCGVSGRMSPHRAVPIVDGAKTWSATANHLVVAFVAGG